MKEIRSIYSNLSALLNGRAVEWLGIYRTHTLDCPIFYLKVGGVRNISYIGKGISKRTPEQQYSDCVVCSISFGCCMTAAKVAFTYVATCNQCCGSALL
jgi:hypothetical protein